MSQPDGPLELIGRQLKDKSQPFTLLIHAQLKPEAVNTFRPFAVAAAEGTRQEPGNIEYQYHLSTEKPGHIIVFERWKNLDALAQHLAAQYTVNVLGAFERHSAAPLQLEVFQIFAE